MKIKYDSKKASHEKYVALILNEADNIRKPKYDMADYAQHVHKAVQALTTHIIQQTLNEIEESLGEEMPQAVSQLDNQWIAGHNTLHQKVTQKIKSLRE